MHITITPSKNGGGNMKRMKKLWIVTGIIVGILSLIIFINFIPTYRLKTAGMMKLEGKWVDVYYEKEEEAAVDVFSLADSKAEELASILGFTEKQDIKIFIYDNQSTMQTKKYGFIGPILGLDWYVGDNRGTDVLLTSPANPGKVHSYENNKYVSLHEMVHAYISVINPNIPLWLTEGMALFLSNGEPFNNEYWNYGLVPTYEEIYTKNPIKFSKMGGYSLAHTYIEYLNVTYGWEKVIELIKTENYQEIFGKSAQVVYGEWVEYIKDYK